MCCRYSMIIAPGDLRASSFCTFNEAFFFGFFFSGFLPFIGVVLSAEEAAAP
jgi:hypothetical protein